MRRRSLAAAPTRGLLKDFNARRGKYHVLHVVDVEISRSDAVIVTIKEIFEKSIQGYTTFVHRVLCSLHVRTAFLHL